MNVRDLDQNRNHRKKIEITSDDVIELCSDDSYQIFDFVNQLEQGNPAPVPMFNGMSLNIEKGHIKP